MRNNARRADYQQERRERLAESYIAGFVDGEGTFHVAFQRAPWTRFGWQIIPEFRVNQHGASRNVLERIQWQLQCGHLKLNHAGSNDHTVVLAVRDRNDLLTKVIPFFERYHLHTAKRQDFLMFARIVKAMARREHLTQKGFHAIVYDAFTMNAHGSQRKYSPAQILKNVLESSETIRSAPERAEKI